MKRIEDEENEKELETETVAPTISTEETNPKDKNEPSIKMIEMQKILLIKYEYVKTLKLEERMTPKKYIMTSENRKRIEHMNKVLNNLIKTIAITDLTKLNELHYATIITLVGVIEPKSSKLETKYEPDRFVKEDIN